MIKLAKAKSEMGKKFSLILFLAMFLNIGISKTSGIQSEVKDSFPDDDLDLPPEIAKSLEAFTHSA